MTVEPIEEVLVSTLAELVQWQERVLQAHAQTQPVKWMPSEERHRRAMQDHAMYVVATLYTHEERRTREMTIETMLRVGQLALDEVRYWRKKGQDTPAIAGIIEKAPLLTWDVWVPHTGREEIEALGLLWRIWRAFDDQGRSRLLHWMRFRETLIVLKWEKEEKLRAVLRDELIRDG